MPKKKSQCPIEDKERQLLRIFQFIDALFHDGQYGNNLYLPLDTIVIDGKTVKELLPQIIELSRRGAFNSPLYLTQHEGSAPVNYLVIHKTTEFIDHWQRQVSSVFGNT